MERALRACAVLLLLGAASASAAIRTHRIARTSRPPKIDGALDDPCWREALAIEGFALLGLGTKTAAVPPTRAMLAYGADALYVAYRCGEPLSDRLLLAATGHDGKTWADDCVELFFNPSGDRQHYVQIVVNAAGVVMDASYDGPSRGMDLAYESGAEAATRVGKGTWSVEVRIPFAGLPLTRPSGAWVFHLARTRARAGQHLTMLRTPAAGFHEIAKFDRLEGIELPERPVTVDEVSLGERFLGENIARARLKNWGRQTAQVVATVGFVGAEERLEKRIALAGGQERAVELPWTLDAAAADRRIVLEARLGERVLRRAVAAVGEPPKVLGAIGRNAWFIWPDAFVRLELPVRIAEGSRRDAQLRWEARTVGGTRVGGGLTTVRGPTVVVRLYWPRWRPGRYTLRFELARGDRVLASADHTVLLVESPTGDD